MEINRVAKVAPFMDQEAFAEVVGVSLGVIRAQVKKGYLPTIKLTNGDSDSKRSYINCVVLTQFLEEQGAEWLQQMLGGSR